jgi:hypothetical protein
MIPTEKYYLNLTITSNLYKRLYVLIANVGLFAYFQEGTAILRSVPIDKCECFEVQVIDTDTSLVNNTLRIKGLDSVGIC